MPLGFKTKRGAMGELLKYKARLVIKGFLQRYGIDYDETYAPVMKYTSLRLLLTLAAIYDWEIQQFDVVSAFLNAELKEEVYMEQPEGFQVKGEETKVLRLVKALYGLKQAPHEWNGDIDNYLRSIGFERCESDTCVYYWEAKNGMRIYLGLFVDDALVLFPKTLEEEWNKLKRLVQKKYQIEDMGEAKFILGMRITRDRSQRVVYLDQQAYVEKVAARFNLSDASAEIPGTTMEIMFEKNENSKQLNKEEQNAYQQVTGSAMYAAISTRLDIAHAVALSSRFNKEANEIQAKAAKKIIKYLNRTKEIKLKLDGKINGKVLSASELPMIFAFADSDWAGDKKGLKSTTGYLVKLNNAPIHWISRKQKSVSKSSCEAEIIATGECIQELIWLRNFLTELLMKKQKSMNFSSYPFAVKFQLFGDNQSALRILQTDMSNSLTKHIAVNYSFTRDFLGLPGVNLGWIRSEDQLADILTKPLGRELFKRLRLWIMGV